MPDNGSIQKKGAHEMSHGRPVQITEHTTVTELQPSLSDVVCANKKLQIGFIIALVVLALLSGFVARPHYADTKTWDSTIEVIDQKKGNVLALTTSCVALSAGITALPGDTGTPVAEQLEMMQKVLPDVKKVGLLYCTAESNSDVQIKAAKKELDKLGLEYTDFTVSSSNEIQSVVESAVGKVDALYSPTDNTIAAGASQVGQICKENKLPFVTGEEGMCMAGGLFTLSINYEDLGYAAGEMAVKILKGEAKPEDMPIKHLSSKDLVVVKNDEMAEALGIDLSALDA